MTPSSMLCRIDGGGLRSAVFRNFPQFIAMYRRLLQFFPAIACGLSIMRACWCLLPSPRARTRIWVVCSGAMQMNVMKRRTVSSRPQAAGNMAPSCEGNTLNRTTQGVVSVKCWDLCVVRARDGVGGGGAGYCPLSPPEWSFTHPLSSPLPQQSTRCRGCRRQVFLWGHVERSGLGPRGGGGGAFCDWSSWGLGGLSHVLRGLSVGGGFRATDIHDLRRGTGGDVVFAQGMRPYHSNGPSLRLCTAWVSPRRSRSQHTVSVHRLFLWRTRGVVVCTHPVSGGLICHCIRVTRWAHTKRDGQRAFGLVNCCSPFWRPEIFWSHRLTTVEGREGVGVPLPPSLSIPPHPAPAACPARISEQGAVRRGGGWYTGALMVSQYFCTPDLGEQGRGG